MHVIGTAGHVDHGKSTLVERLTGIDPDRFAEEKRRGLTIDLGFAWLDLPSGREIGLIDVPGHERFIKNMLAGAGGISICLFVVAANEGWMPQSAEHLAILEVLGVSRGVVAVTKSDTVDDETLELAVLEAREHLAPTSLRDAPIVACSAATGSGMTALVAALDEVVGATPEPPDEGRARLWVDRVFTIAGAGTVVTGTLAGGRVAAGDEVEVAPEGRRARVRAIQTHKKEVATAAPGSRVALNLAGLDRRAARRGDAIVHPGRWRPTTRIDALLVVLPPVITGIHHVLEERGAHLLYAGSAETPARIKLLEGDRVEAGDEAFAQVYLRDPLPLQRGDRFVLRDAGRVLTLGGGTVLDPVAPPARRGDAGHLALLRRTAASDPEDALVALLDAAGALDAREALLRAGTSRAPASVARLGSRLFSAERMSRLRAGAVDALARHHRDRPLQRGMGREALRAALGLELAELDDLLAGLEDVVAEGPLVRLASHRVRLGREQEAARARVVEAIDAGAFAPPPASELAADPALLRALVEAGDIVPVAHFFLTRARAAEARTRVRASIEASGPLTVAAIRDLLGTSRKYAVPLCEWLDATGATRRRGDLRVLGPDA